MPSPEQPHEQPEPFDQEHHADDLAHPTETWDMPSLGQALGTQPELASDVAFGAGYTLDVGGKQHLQLEIYPGSRVTRLTGVDAQLSLFRQSPPEIGDNGVIFEHHHDDHHLTLAVMPEGYAVLSVGTKDLRTPQDDSERPDTSPERTNDRNESEDAVAGDSGAPQTLSSGPVETPISANRIEQERLHLHGRVGASPAFRTSRNGVLIAQFPLGVHDKEDPDKTTWHTVVAFNQRAEKLRTSLKKGQAVEVIGYLHIKEQQGKDGQPKRVEQIYATVIKHR